MSAQNDVKVDMIFFDSGCYLRYLLLISPYHRGLCDLTIQCLTVNSMCSLKLIYPDLSLVLGIYHVFGRRMI